MAEELVASFAGSSLELARILERGLSAGEARKSRELLGSMSAQEGEEWLALGSDGIVILLARMGNASAFEQLKRGFAGYVGWLIKQFTLPGEESGDLQTEAYLALFDEIKKYSPQCGYSFEICVKKSVRNAMLALAKKAGRLKHRPLNFSLRLEAPLRSDDEGGAWEDVLIGEDGRKWEVDQESTLISGSVESLIDTFKLTILEARVIVNLRFGYTNEESARILDRTHGSINGALLRSRAKIREICGVEKVVSEPISAFSNPLTRWERIVSILSSNGNSSADIAELSGASKMAVEHALKQIAAKGFRIGLSPIQNRAVQLYLDGNGIKRTAQILGVKLNCVANAIQNARRKLRLPIVRRKNSPLFTVREQKVKDCLDQGMTYQKIYALLPEYTHIQIQGAGRAIQLKTGCRVSGRAAFGSIQQAVKDALERGLTYDQMLEEMPGVRKSQLMRAAHFVRLKMDAQSRKERPLTVLEQTIADKYREGKTDSVIAAELATELGGNWSSKKVSAYVSKICWKQNLPKMNRHPRKEGLDPQEEQVCAFIREGIESAEMAKLMGITVKDIYNIRSRMQTRGIVLPEKPVKLTETERRVLELAGGIINLSEVARRLGVGASTVKEALRGASKKGFYPEPK